MSNRRDIRLDFIGGRRPAFLSESETKTVEENVKSYKPVKDEAVKNLQKMSEEAIESRSKKIKLIIDAVKEDIVKWNNFSIQNENKTYFIDNENKFFCNDEQFDLSREINEIETLFKDITVQSIQISKKHAKLQSQHKIALKYVDTAYNNISCIDDNIFNDTPRHLVREVLRSGLVDSC